MVGGGIGYALMQLQLGDSAGITYAACALVGALVGVICGKAPWRSETIWTPVVKAIVGGIIGVGLGAAGVHFLPLVKFPAIAGHELTTHDGSVLAVAIGILYGIFVEIDDGGKDDKPARPAANG
jgi:hypothetical protein